MNLSRVSVCVRVFSLYCCSSIYRGHPASVMAVICPQLPLSAPLNALPTKLGALVPFSALILCLRLLLVVISPPSHVVFKEFR